MKEWPAWQQKTLFHKKFGEKQRAVIADVLIIEAA
jgi:hypothetical protein